MRRQRRASRGKEDLDQFTGDVGGVERKERKRSAEGGRLYGRVVCAVVHRTRA